MKDKLNIGVLVTARNVYMDYLKKKLSPLLLDGIISLYKGAVETQTNIGSYKYNKQFQIFLNQIPDWNQTTLVNETKRIIDEINYLQKLVAAIFMSEVRILTSIRLAGDNSVFQIKIPKSDLLIHKIYIYIAKNIYSSIDLLDKFKDIEKNKKNYDDIKLVIENTIEDTIINELIPIKNILEEYLSDTILTDISREPVENNEDSDSDSNTIKNEDEIIDNIDNLFKETPEEKLLTNNFGTEPGTESEPDTTITVDLNNPNTNTSKGFFSNLFGAGPETPAETPIDPNPVDFPGDTFPGDTENAFQEPEQSVETGETFQQDQQGDVFQPDQQGETEQPVQFEEPVYEEEETLPEGEQQFGSEYNLPNITQSEQSFF